MSFGPVLPARLSFHPSHHPRDFLRVPEWSYGSSKRLSLTRIKLSLPPIKALRVAPKPPAKKEKRLSLEGVTPAPKVEDTSASGDANGVVVPDKDASAQQTTAVEALQLLKKMRETKNPGGAFTSSDKKADALDEEFSEDPFLDSLRCVFVLLSMATCSLTSSAVRRWLYTSRIQLWRSELIGDDDDDDDDGEPDMDAYLESLAPRMATRAAAWRPTDVDERTPVVKEFRESFVRLQALVSEIEQDKSLFSEEPLPQPAEDAIEEPVLRAPEVSENEQTKGVDNAETAWVLFSLSSFRS